MPHLRWTNGFRSLAVLTDAKLFRAGIAASLAICLFAPQTLAAQDAPLNNPPKFIFLLPEGFHGWICMDFGVRGAAPLPREGDALVIRPREGLVMQTSEEIDPIAFYGEGWIEANGQRRQLPEYGFVSPGFSRMGPREPTQRACDFVGTTEERDVAGPPPGFERSFRQRGTIPPEERIALETLYNATDGERWTHRGGWMGPVGTECNWHGVDCMPLDGSERVVGLSLSQNNLTGTITPEIGKLRRLKWLSLLENNLSGAIPAALADLPDLESLMLLGNHFSGLIPRSLLQKEGLHVIAETPLLTDVSEVDFESDPSSLLCASRRLVFRSNDSVISYEEKCRNATPEDRTTFCEVKEGKSYGALVAIGTLVDKYAFFDMSTEYSRNVTDATFESTRVTTRDGKSHAVVSYAGSGPFELWVIDRVIEGVASSVDWEKTSKQEKCPRW